MTPTLISRAQAWLISFPTLFDLQTLWTGEGDSPAPFERAIPLVGSALWLLIAFCIGSLILGWPIGHAFYKVTEDRSKKAEAITRIGFAVATGHCTLLIVIALHTVLFPPNFIPGWLLPIAILVACILRWNILQLPLISRIAKSSATSFANPHAESPANSPAVSATKFDPPDLRDPSWLFPWSRRLIGVTFLACLALGLVGLLGSTLPSYDIDVRENDWLIIKSNIDPTASPISESNTSLQSLPAARGIPALGLARFASSVGLLDPSIASSDNQVPLLRIMLIGQCIDAWMFLLAVAILVRLSIEHYGALAGWTVGLLFLGHPGLHELSRLGLGAGLSSLVITLSFAWLIHGQRFPSTHRIRSPQSDSQKLYSSQMLASSLCILAAWGSFPAALFATLPLLVKELMHISIPSLSNVQADDFHRSPAQRQLHPAYLKWSLSLLSLALIAAIAATWLKAPWILPIAGLTDSARSVQANLVTESILNTFARMVLNSASNSIAILPLALAGLTLSRDRRVCLGCLLAGTWWLMWCLLGGRLERGWVIAILWLALPTACGIQQLQNFVGRWFTAPLGWLILTWTCVCIPTWPYCDQRLLASLDQYLPSYLRGGERAASDSSKPTENKSSESKPRESQRSGSQSGESAPYPLLDNSPYYPAYSDWVESVRKRDAQSDRSPRWLVLGTSDVFFWRVGTYTHPWWHKDVDISDPSLLEHLGVGYILVDYEGLHSRIEQRDRWARHQNHVNSEQTHDELATLREHIEGLVRSGILERCDPWGNASEVECYRVLSYNP